MKIARSMPAEIEEEAIRHYDMSDQIVFSSAKLMSLSSIERQSDMWSKHWNGLFWYVIGYGQAKGWKTQFQCGSETHA